MMTLLRTPSQTVGPYYAIGLCRRPDDLMDPEGVELTGGLFDGRGDPIPDGMVELWDVETRKWGRCGTHPAGRFSFRVPAEAEVLEGYVFARGLLRHQRFRVFLRDLTRDADGRLVFDVHMQGDDETVFYKP
jgi:protocatechuate 3,4-dioxygenase, alpha subunit